ncbi:MAG: magnesium transporter [Roseburia sp.]|nr:magnesium transporter [Anaeroplasma bactoclasticum]MCM1196169.1 magnesium transporter [Roseburia sp.]MCM1556257.1 magnesium transporter [Anaeroplasma bactoclasticum]
MIRDYVEELIKIIESNKNEEEQKSLILQYHESDIADALANLNKDQRLKLYHILGEENVSEIFAYLDNVADYVEELSQEKAADIIELMDSDDAIDVLEELDEDDRKEIESLMEPDSIEDIKLIDQFSEEQIGSKMTTNFILISKSNNVKTAMKRVIKEAAENDNVSTIYVEDEYHHFFGALDLRDLIIARENDDLVSLMKQNYPYFYANEEVTDCIGRLRDYALDSYPILNAKNEIIGVVTSDDVVEVLDEEMGDDYAKLGGLTEEENLNESVFLSVKKRLPWLIALLFLGLVVSSLISGFETVVAALPVIVFFQSLILDMAGNTGTQSLAVTIRMLSVEEVKAKDLLKLCFKEIRVGFMNGVILAILAFAFVFCFLFITKQSISGDVYDHLQALKASGIVALSLLMAMTICSLIGSAIPIFFMKIKIDPAVASGPFITTLNDIIAIVLYYGLAYLLFLAF